MIFYVWTGIYAALEMNVSVDYSLNTTESMIWGIGSTQDPMVTKFLSTLKELDKLSHCCVPVWQYITDDG